MIDNPDFLRATIEMEKSYLNLLINEFGLNDERVLKASQRLDKDIARLMLIEEVKHIEKESR